MSMTAKHVKTISIWKHKTFTILFVNSLLLSIGNKIYEIVLPLLMYEMTHSSISMMSMRTAELLPNLFFAIFVGVIVDRVNKKKWAIWMVALQAACLFLLVYLFKANNHILSIYYSLGFLLMTFNYGYFNAQVSLTKQSVPLHYLTSANAKFSLVETLVTVMAPAFTGLLLLMTDLSDGVLLTAMCYVISLLLLTQMASSKAFNMKQKSHFGTELKEGWVFFKNNRSLWMMTVFVIFINCPNVIVSTTVVFFAKDVLQLSSSVLSIVLCMEGVGGIAGSLLIKQFKDKFGFGKVFGVSILLNAIGYLVIMLSHSILVLSIGLFLIGFAVAIYNISVYTFRHEQTPDRLMGRISGITGTLFRIGMPFMMYLSGWMIVWWGTTSVFLCSALLNLLIFLMFLFTHLWRLR